MCACFWDYMAGTVETIVVFQIAGERVPID